jgi:prepilin-type N-terminal cleavage/methylation domain-containing protein
MGKTRSVRGFTLIEMVVVIGIIAILSAASIVGYTRFIRQARESRVDTELAVIIRQIELAYYADPYEGDDGSPFTVGYDVSGKTFSIMDETGALTLQDAESRLAEAINSAITRTSGDPETIAQTWIGADDLENATTDAVG